MKLLKGRLNLRFLIFGPCEGNEEKKINELIKKYSMENEIKLMDAIYGDDKFKVLQSADLFLLPSRAEAQPVSALEALACGLPAVVSNAAGFKELLDFNAGRIINIYNPKESAEMIYNILIDDEQRQIMRINARKLVEDNFTIDVMLNNLEILYNKIINNNNKVDN
jgi:glycosyltransferase involved in cell wall biosynthesis